MISETTVSRDPTFRTLARNLSWGVLLISILQAVFFLIHPFTISGAAGIVLAALQISVAAICLTKNSTRLAALAGIIYIAQAGIFAATLYRMDPPLLPRLLLVAASAALVCPALTILLIAAQISPVPAVRVSLLIVSLFFATEAILGMAYQTPVAKTIETSALIRAMLPDSRLGAVNVPNTEVPVYYSGDPAASFREADPREGLWWLRVAGGSQARLVFPPDSPDTERIEIAKAATNNLFDIQLNQPRFRAKANSKYVLDFRARADRPRLIHAGFARAHGDWNGLGLYSVMPVTPQWQNFSYEFTTLPTADDDDARVFFDVGDNDASVEVAAVRLRSQPDGAALSPGAPSGYYIVHYKFNTNGCRGPDYEIPKPTGTTRLLMLGNSYTLGAGLPDENIASTRLQQILGSGSDGSGSKYEVINCGVAGYGTHQQRLFYERLGAKYQPDIVLAGVTWRDDVSVWEESEDAHPGRLGSLFYAWRILKERLRPRPHTDFSRCVEELRQLDGSVRKHGARLVVFLFRNNADYTGSTASGEVWNKLTKTITDGLKNTGIPVLDTGKALAETNSVDDLKAHATIEFEPNQAAHTMAARELAGLIRDKHLRP